MKFNAQQIQAMAAASYAITFSSERAAELADELERHSRDVARAALALELDDPIWAHAERMHRDAPGGVAPRVTADE